MVNIGAFHKKPALHPDNQRLRPDNHLATLAQVPETGAPISGLCFWEPVKEVIVAGRKKNWLEGGRLGVEYSLFCAFSAMGVVCIFEAVLHTMAPWTAAL